MEASSLLRGNYPLMPFPLAQVNGYDKLVIVALLYLSLEEQVRFLMPMILMFHTVGNMKKSYQRSKLKTKH